VKIPFRTYVRIVLVVALAALVWRRYSSVSTTRLVVVGAGVLILAAVVWQMTSALRKSRKLRDEVPKNPLGLDS
jgi:O-antigen ligase